MGPLGGLELLKTCGTGVARWRARRGLLLGSIMIFRHYKDHYKEHKEGYEEGNKDQDFMRVWDSVRHAQAQGLARRISKAQQSCDPATALGSLPFDQILIG